MINLLIETKNEYTIHLSNILAPLVYEGFQSIYKKAQKISLTNDILKIYQDFLKQIPEWNENTIDNETNRIIDLTHSKDWLIDLVKATIKSNLIVLTYNPNVKNKYKVDSKLYQNIKINNFIHKIYIECARELWNNPYLLYHDYSPIEIKRNQRDTIIIIKDCIKESLRKILQEYFKHILQIYLGEDLEDNTINNNFDETISEVEKRNIIKLAKKDLEVVKSNDDLFNDKDDDNYNDNFLCENNDDDDNKIDDEIKTDKTIGSKILEIISKKDISKQSIDSETSYTNVSKQDKSDLVTSNTSVTQSKTSMIDKIDNFLPLQNIPKEKKKEKLSESTTKNSKHLSETDKKEKDLPSIDIDIKIKKILQKDLASVNSETSLNNTIDIFSNSNNSNKKIFNNYLNF